MINGDKYVTGSCVVQVIYQSGKFLLLEMMYIIQIIIPEGVLIILES